MNVIVMEETRFQCDKRNNIVSNTLQLAYGHGFCVLVSSIASRM